MSSRTDVNPYFHGNNSNIWGLVFAFGEKFFGSMVYIRLSILAFFLLFGITGSVNAQIIYEESFDLFEFNCLSQGTEAGGFDPGSGAWAVTDLAGNGVVSNQWYISNSTVGDGFVGGCTQGCFGFGTRTLHVGNSTGIVDQGAFYEEQGNTLFATNKRVESPVIDCSGSFNNTLTVFYAHNSPNPSDNCTLTYFDGVIWTDLQQLAPTGLCGFDVTQMFWDEVTVNLPASANSNPNVRIGFRWVNDDLEPMVGLRPSVAIDNIRVDAGPPPDLPMPDFSVFEDNTQFCEQTSITFLQETTFDATFSDGPTGATFSWVFDGGLPATSMLQNPTIEYNVPGVYDVTLTVTDNVGTSDPFTQIGYITVDDCGPTIVVDVDNAMPCSNEQCVNFSSANSTGTNIDPSSWVWTFTSESGLDIINSTDPNPTNICLNEVGFYDVTVEATDDELTETITLEDYIEVLDCAGPDIAFTVSQQVICVGACIEFTDESTTNNTITAWNWTLPGGQAEGEDDPEISTQQNPVVCYDTPGAFWAVLSAVDNEGESARPDSVLITVDACTGPPQANFTASDTVICQGDCVDFQNTSLGLQEDYQWIFAGVNEVSNEENPMAICYDEPGTYDVTLIVSNEVDIPSQNVQVDFITVEACIGPPVPRISVSEDTICAGKCVDFFSESTGVGSEFFEHEWVFAGAVEGSETSMAVDPAEVCYNEPGVYDVVLTVTRPGSDEDSTRVFEDVVTVINTPECRPMVIPNIPDTICAGDCAFFSAEFVDADSVRWTFDGGNPETSTAFEPGLVCFEEIGEYTIILQAFNESGEAPPVIQTIFVGQRPPLDAGPDLVINAGAVVELTASLGGQEPNGTFLWQPFEQVDNFSFQTVTVSPDETTQFIVYYEQDSSCTAVDTVTVNVNFRQAIGVPNSFSPNGDGLNDELRVLGQGIARMEFKVFNRYGQLVFETTRQEEGWDGLFKEKELNAGTFVYTLEVTFAEGNREIYTGDVTLVR